MAEGAWFALYPCVRRHVRALHAMVRGMTTPDFNLLITLDVLLSEGSVAAAARRLQLSPSAMSRALARLRETLGDPLLVRAGRNLVPTPRALELREPVSLLVREVESVLRPVGALDPAQLVRSFSVRTSDGFVENFGPALLARVGAEAPGVRLRFVPKMHKGRDRGRDSAPLREGAIDLETGVVGDATAPELRVQALFRDRFIGAVRMGHPLSHGEITAARYAAAGHIGVSRGGSARGAIDEALQPLGLERRVVTIVGGFATALALARGSDLVASVPERHTGNLRAGLFCFPLPVTPPQITVSLIWHPRLDADPAHRWLRSCVREVCAAALGPVGDPLG